MVKRTLRKFANWLGLNPQPFRRAVDYINDHYGFRKSIDRIGAVDKAAQIGLLLQYRELARNGAPLPSFTDVEFRAFSQNGEDGILLYIFGLIGWTNRVCVEMCAGDGIESNSANLIINHGFHGVLFDGNADLVTRGQRFYTRLPETRLSPPRLVHAWITRDNVNSLLRDNGAAGAIDLFTLDMDGVDYWIWEAIDAVQPRVFVAEFNNLWPADACKTVPYADDFRTAYNKDGCDYAGASLGAFVKLAAKKGYRLVGAQQLGFNAFFVRNGIGEGVLPAVTPESCVTHPFARRAREERLPKVSAMPWVEV